MRTARIWAPRPGAPSFGLEWGASCELPESGRPARVPHSRPSFGLEWGASCEPPESGCPTHPRVSDVWEAPMLEAALQAPACSSCPSESSSRTFRGHTCHRAEPVLGRAFRHDTRTLICHSERSEGPAVAMRPAESCSAPNPYQGVPSGTPLSRFILSPESALADGTSPQVPLFAREEKSKSVSSRKRKSTGRTGAGDCGLRRSYFLPKMRRISRVRITAPTMATRMV